MKLVANIQLKPTAEQAQHLRRTLRKCNEACNWISKTGRAEGTVKQYHLHKLVYVRVRKEFSLPAQMAVRCIAKVADAYKCGNPNTVRKFSHRSAQPYDDRILRFKGDDAVSIRLLDEREVIPFVCGDRQRKLLENRKGESDLMFVGGKWYISCVCDIPDPEKIKTDEVIGIDLGIVNLAFDSDGERHSGSDVKVKNQTYNHRRKNLQKKRTRAAKRKLRQLSGKQKRYQKDVNHRISKNIVDKAKRTCRAISLENLKGIRGRVTARRRQRSTLHNWSFAQLRTYIEYKAVLAGVQVIVVDPRNTSRQCPECGHVEKSNRKTQSEFLCVSCGLAGLADHIAARNIRARAVVNQPMVAGAA